MPLETLTLVVNDDEFRGWTDMHVSSAIDACSSLFSFGYTEQIPNEKQSWNLFPGMRAQVKMSSDFLVNGYINLIRPSFTATTHSLFLQGRDKTADIIDCSADQLPGQWSNLTTLALATLLCKPYSFSVKMDVGVEVGAPIPIIRLQQGESVMEMVARYCLMRKQLIMPDGSGNLLITRAGNKRAEVSLLQGPGGNILTGSGVIDDSQIYSDYTVKGQSTYDLDSDVAGECHLVGRAKDPTVKRFRPLVIMAENAVDLASVKALAEWEAAVRTGQSRGVEIVVKGWRQRPGGAPWAPNLIVGVGAPMLKIEDDMLIRQVEFQKGLEGEETRLSLVSPQAYASKPPIEKKDKNFNPWLSGLTS